MIYYFSGTQNSKYVAYHLGKLLQDDITFIPNVIKNNCETEIYDQVIGIVFPIHSWGVPKIVLKFVENLRLSQSANHYIYMVCTCGDDVGYAPEMLDKVLRKKGFMLNAAFSILMPNTYVLLPGFDVDSDKLVEQKINHAPQRIKEISDIIKLRGETIDVVRGNFPKFKTKIIYPIFQKIGINTKKWNVDSQKCISCGRCKNICPVGNIEIIDRTPTWSSNCTSCLACFHICPHHAINYGKSTFNKSQFSPISIDKYSNI